MAEVSFGEWLKRRRGAEGWTQKQLAQRINCSISALRKMEAEERHPSAQVVERLAELFQIPPMERKSFLRFARGDWQSFLGSETEAAPWQATSNLQPTNLPASITSFIGREKEQDEIIDLLAKNRLVTLAGTGGIGKTRLALQVGQKLTTNYPNGVWFVALDSLSDPALVPQTVASAFDIREASKRSILERLRDALHNKTTLIILDNCEHLLQACAQLMTFLLANCRNLKILTTSRELLNVTGEAAYYMPALSTPEFEYASVETLGEYESIQLFVERATLASSSFKLTNKNAQIVVDICRRVDGIPLAIELAAARMNILQAEEIHKQLQDSFNLLSKDSRIAESRHQTLQASIDWSWGLLTPAEQIFMQQLSVFAGGWTLASAQAVCEGDILNLTSALVKKSLIVVNQEMGRETRYRFHEIVRQYARERLLESGKEAGARKRHLQYFLQLSEHAETGLRGPTQVEWMSRLNHERDNLRAALEWANTTDVEAGLYLASRLNIFWEIFDAREGAHWLEEFIQNSKSKAYPHARAKALHALGWSKQWFERIDEALSMAQESRGLYRACGDKAGEVEALLLLAATLNPAEADGYAQEALTLALSINDKWTIARALFVASWGHPERDSYSEKALSLFQEVGDLRNMAECMAELGRLRMLNNDIESAQNILSQVAVLFRKLNIKSGISGVLQAYGRIAAIRGEYEQAYTCLQEAAALDEEHGYRISYLFDRALLGYLSLNRGKLAEANEIFTETLQNFYSDKNEIGVAFTLEGKASFFVASARSQIAAQLIGWADASRERTGDHRFPLEQADVDKTIAACLAKMGEGAFTDAHEEGQKMSMDEAVTYALEAG